MIQPRAELARRPNVPTGVMMAARKPTTIQRFKRKRQQSPSQIQRLVRCVLFLPLFYLLLKRVLLFPFEDSALSGYMDVENIAVTTTVKKPEVKRTPAAVVRSHAFDTPGKRRKSLEALTQPFRVTDTSSLRCSTKGELSIAGYRHLGATAFAEVRTESMTGRQQKIPKLLHQQGPSRCVSSFLYDLNELWAKQLEVDNDDGREWSMFFHTEDAMTRLFRAVIAVQGEEKYLKHLPLSRIGKEFPHLGQILRNCVDNGSFSKRLLWRFLCLYAYGGIYIDMGNPVLAQSYDDLAKTIIRDSYDTVLLWTTIEDGLEESDQPESEPEVQINPIIMAASPGHPFIYYAVQHTLIEVMTDGYLGEDVDDQINKSSQIVVVSNILKRALADFHQENNLDTESMHATTHKMNSNGGSLNRSPRVKTFPGTGNESVTILDGPGAGFLYLPEITKRMTSLFERSELAGKRGTSLEKSREKSSSCLYKSLVDASSTTTKT